MAEHTLTLRGIGGLCDLTLLQTERIMKCLDIDAFKIVKRLTLERLETFCSTRLGLEAYICSYT